LLPVERRRVVLGLLEAFSGLVSEDSSQRPGCLGFSALPVDLGGVDGFLGLSSALSAGWIGARRLRVAAGLSSFSTDTGADIERPFPAKRAFGVLFGVVSTFDARGEVFAGCVPASDVLSLLAGEVFLVDGLGVGAVFAAGFMAGAA
jgi:hypothetical protein